MANGTSKMVSSIGLIAVVLAGAAGSALADSDARGILAVNMHYRATDIAKDLWSKADFEQDPGQCARDLANAKKAGVKDSDKISYYTFKVHPKAVDKGNNDFEVSVADAGWFCERYQEVRAHQELLRPVAEGHSLAEWMTMVKPEETSGDHSDKIKTAEKCLDALDEMVKRGMKNTDTIKVNGGMTIDAARTVCTQAVVDAKKFAGAVSSREKATKDKAIAKYKSAGIKGDRLELFAYYDMAWYLPGCESSTDDPKQLKKAKKLFQWLTDTQTGVITIRKFTFKGDKYTKTEKTYVSETAAYRGCR